MNLTISIIKFHYYRKCMDNDSYLVTSVKFSIYINQRDLIIFQNNFQTYTGNVFYLTTILFLVYDTS